MNFKSAVAIDAVCVVVFCAIGRRSHEEGITLAGLAKTAWPFLTGAAVGWLLSCKWQGLGRPAAVNPTGLAVWLSTVVVGMVLRKLSGQGVAFSFVIVAATVTAVLLLGWRALAALLSRR